MGFAQTQLTFQPDNQTLEILDAPDQQVIALSKNVIVRKHAKEVFVFGGDLVIEGRVEGDVGVIGGNIIQREGAFIGGDVIVFGGAYRADGPEPLRAEKKQTIVFGIFEDELRNIGQNPSQLFSPSLTPAFIAQRILSILFWFVVTFLVTTIAPGAVSRAIVRFQLSTAKVVGIGLAGLIFATVGVVVSLGMLPDYLSAVVWLMTFALLMLAYLFGRVTMHLSVGKLVQRYFSPDRKHSETAAILIGVLIWSILLSIPYIWTIALLALFAVGIGLVFTARSDSRRRSE